MMKPLPIQIPEDEIAEFCRQNGIKRLALFGSVVREDFTPESDVDVLVEFWPESIPGLFGMVRMERELSELMGRKVDFRTAGDLSKYFVDRVLREAEVIYVAACEKAPPARVSG